MMSFDSAVRSVTLFGLVGVLVFALVRLFAPEHVLPFAGLYALMGALFAVAVWNERDPPLPDGRDE